MVITFGELMLRLSTTGYQRFIQTGGFEATFGGSEANICVALANYGISATFVSKVPKNELGQAAINSLRRYGVNTEYMQRGGERLGIYFVEKGASQRASKVIYDRKGSSFAEANSQEFPWEQIFSQAKWFHFTGITPALSDSAAKICEEACKEAKKRNIIVSCDLNYRKNLWSKVEANEVMKRLMVYVDICIGNEEDAANVFSIHAEEANIINGTINEKNYSSVAKKLVEMFNFKMVAITLRSSISASDNKWSAMLFDGNKYYMSKSYDIHIIDRIGGGDSFASGLIYSFLEGKKPDEALEFAVAASCLKHSVEGDFNLVSLEEINKLAKGDGSGRVER